MHISVLAVLPLLPSLVLAAARVPDPAHRRHHARVIARAGAPYDNDTLASISASEASDVSATLTHTSTSAAASTGTTTSAVSSQSTDDDDITSASTVPSSSAAPTTTSTTDIVSTPPSFTSTTPISTDPGPSTIAVPSSPTDTSSAAPTTTAIVTRPTSAQLVTTVKKTTSASTATAAASNSATKSSGLSKPAMIAIIVVAVVVGAVAIGWTAFRKWKLKPSKRFDSRMKPIDFSPQGGAMNDDFLEKTLHRSVSNSSADRQRQQFVSELDDPNHVPGVPEHDFTAGPGVHGIYDTSAAGAYDPNAYHADPFAHAQAYDYDAEYHDAAQHSYPPHQQGYAAGDYPTQDPGQQDYADLQRGGSVGHGSNGHAQGVYQADTSFPEPFGGLGRPTGGSDGPYAQAAQYRSY